MQVERATNEQIEAMMEAGQPLPLYRLGLAIEGCATQEEMNENFFATLERGYEPINAYLGAFSGVCSIVGSAPSLEQTHQDLRGDVIAINGAISYLLKRGIVPKWAMLWDAAEVVAQFAEPHPDITYLVASRCHPAVFERLAGSKVVVWHAAGDSNIAELMRREDVIAKQPCEEPLINGGTAGVTRCIFLATCLGYKELHIFGGDSSYSDDGRTHVTGSLVPEKDVRVALGNNPPIFFRTTPEWCAQVEEYRSFYTILTCGGPDIKLEVHGGGMLGTMHEILVAQLAHLGRERFIEKNVQLEREKEDLYASASEEFDAVKNSQSLEEMQ